MDDGDFEKQFKQNLEKSLDVPVPKKESNGLKLSLVISIILALVVLVESIALAVMVTNYFGTFESSGAEEIEYDETEYIEDEEIVEEDVGDVEDDVEDTINVDTEQ